MTIGVFATIRFNGWFEVPFYAIVARAGKVTFKASLVMSLSRKKRASLTGPVLAELLGDDRSLIVAWRKDITIWEIDKLAKGKILEVDWSMDDMIVTPSGDYRSDVTPYVPGSVSGER